MALDTTNGGTEADSYITVAEHHTYILEFHNRNISANEVAADEANLRRAAQILDWSWQWKGVRNSQNQNLAWPRHLLEEYYYNYEQAGAYYWPNDFADGLRFDADVVPLNIRRAQSELADVLSTDIDLFPTISDGTIRSESGGAGPARFTVNYDQVLERPRVTRILHLIAPYHDGGAGGLDATQQVVRG